MAQREKDGISQVNFELPTELLRELEAFAQARGQTKTYAFHRAIRRHLDSPPPIAEEPALPPCVPDPVPAKKPGRKGKMSRG